MGNTLRTLASLGNRHAVLNCRHNLCNLTTADPKVATVLSTSPHVLSHCHLENDAGPGFTVVIFLVPSLGSVVR